MSALTITVFSIEVFNKHFKPRHKFQVIFSVHLSTAVINSCTPVQW